MKKRLKNILNSWGYTLISNAHYAQLQDYKKQLSDRSFSLFYTDQTLSDVLKFKQFSKAQLKQDLFVLCETNFKKGGFFVEFGATNGIDLSNSWLLENKFDWDGILAEPAICWHTDLVKNRNVKIEKKCVWSITGEKLLFYETDYAELSTLSQFSGSDGHKMARENNKSYEVETISLYDLLIRHNAPKNIDYLSIDTEGSEYEILSNFDFRDYKIRIITVEHNYTPNRKKIKKLLERNGYKNKFSEHSYFDDWYVLVD